MIEQKIKIEKPMKVIMDCGNAAVALMRLAYLMD